MHGDGEGMNGAGDDDGAGRMRGGEGGIEQAAKVGVAAIVTEEVEMDVGAGLERFAEAELAVGIAIEGVQWQGEGEAAVAFAQEQGTGMAAGGAVVHIQGWEGQTGAAGADDEAGNFVLNEPALHGLARAEDEPDGARMAGDELFQSAGGMGGEAAWADVQLALESGAGEAFAEGVKEDHAPGVEGLKGGGHEQADGVALGQAGAFGRGLEDAAAGADRDFDEVFGFEFFEGGAEGFAADLEGLGEVALGREMAGPQAGADAFAKGADGLGDQGDALGKRSLEGEAGFHDGGFHREPAG